MRTRVKLVIGVAAAIAALMAAAPAQAAGDPTAADDQYGAVLGEQTGGPGGVQGTGSLPFTGLDLVTIAATGAGLIAGGGVLRHRTRSRGGTGSAA